MFRTKSYRSWCLNISRYKQSKLILRLECKAPRVQWYKDDRITLVDEILEEEKFTMRVWEKIWIIG